MARDQDEDNKDAAVPVIKDGEEDAERAITLEVRDYIGIITIDVAHKLNALSAQLYGRIVELLEQLAANEATYVTVITAKGSFFSSGADVGTIKQAPEATSAREFWVSKFVANAFYQSHAWFRHPKILVAALNGPVVGVTAAFIAHCDFIYAAPHTYLMTPFTSLGLATEGGAARTFIARMGPGLAKEALLMGRRISAEELLSVRFVNKILYEGGGDPATGRGFDRDRFLAAVLQEVDQRLGKHLVKSSLLKIKRLLRKTEDQTLDSTITAEVLSGLDGFMRGVPQEEFRKVKSRQKRHKL